MTRQHRPYAGKGVPSITEVLDCMAVEVLPFAAARETAVRAITRGEEYAHLSDAEAINALARHHVVMWDGAAAMGTLVHSVNEAWVAGVEVDVAELVAEAGMTAWRGRELEVAEHADLYVDGLEKFWRNHRPETIEVETIVRHSRGKQVKYVGTRDWIVKVDGRKFLVEIKTSSKVERKPGDRLWLDHWRLQLAAQRNASHIVTYDDDGNEASVRANDVTVDGCAVLHLCGDGDYGFWEVRAAGDEHGHFMRLVDLYHWWKSGHKEPKPVDLKLHLAVEEGAAA